MLDTITSCAPLCAGSTVVQTPEKADVFVTGQHTAADQATRAFVVRLLEDLGVLKDAERFLPLRPDIPKGATRMFANAEKRIIFMSSFLRAVERNKTFSIQMTPNPWTGSPCGFEAARDVTNALKNTGQIVVVRNAQKGCNATIYRCSDNLAARLAAHHDRLAFKLAHNDIVEVRAPRGEHFGRRKKKARIPLAQFPRDKIQDERNRLHRLNAYLSRYPLVDAAGRPVDTTLKRIFDGDLEHGGRLYGAYQMLRERDRLRCTITSEPVCEIDLKASHVSIAAALLGHPEPLPKDPYSAIPWVRTERDRKAAKLLVQRVIHAGGGRPTQFPKLRNGASFRNTYGFEGKRIGDLLPGIFEIMPFLDGSPSLTMTLQYLEAEMLIDALERLRGSDIPALPIHDSLLVRESDRDAVLEVVQETLRSYLGIHAAWLEVAAAGEDPYLVEPLAYPMDQPRAEPPRISPTTIPGLLGPDASPGGDDIWEDEMVLDEDDVW
ncbi:hypothetical protein [Rhodosalinus sp. K401]|uniref:hypothetical protein n=1 Tax=Rhodosalinus sp. K401 TaxID=3239195 RepID=UPI003525BFA8